MASADPTPIRALIVDDEPLARERLRELLDDRSDVILVGEAEDGPEAVDAIRESGPDLVFLDVQMPGMSGIDVVEEVGPDAMPVTIFVTAYDQYAIKAFDLAAVDYLLKPFDDDRFEEAYQRGVEMRSYQEAEAVADRFRRLLDASEDEDDDDSTEADNTGSASAEEASYLQRITIDLPGKVRVIPVEDIRYVTAEDAYVKIHTDEDAYLLRERMHVLEDRLDPSAFARIHRSTIVRLDLVETVLHRSGGDYSVRLESGRRLDVSRSRREDLLHQLETGAS